MRSVPLTVHLTLALLVALALASCAPGAAPASLDMTNVNCQTSPPPKVAIVEFGNTTSRGGTTVLGVETAATARMITLLKSTGCYEILEKSGLRGVLEEQGLESLEPVELARASGAAYVVTGVVTRATIDRPTYSALGVTYESIVANVEVDVRATDVITGEVVVSMTGRGEASTQNVAVSGTLTGMDTISMDNPEVGPLLANASQSAVTDVVSVILQRF